MKHLYSFLFVIGCYCVNAQCATTMSFNVTPSTCSACCNASATVSHSCAVAYSWTPSGITSANAYNLCSGTYTVYALMVNTVCCGSTVGTATVFIPAAPPSSITELNDLKDVVIATANNGVLISTHSSSEYAVQISIHDLNGRVVYDSSLIINKNGTPVHPDVRDGIYLVTVTNEAKQRLVKKVVIRRE